METAVIVDTMADVVMISGVGRGAPAAAPDDPLDYRCVAITGILTEGHGNSVEEFTRFGGAIGRGLRDLLGATGEWIGVFESALTGEKVLCSDYVGYGQLHYSMVRGHRSLGNVLVAGTSIRGVVSALQSMGVPVTPSFATLIPSLVSSNNIFRTRWSRDTFAAEISVLGSDEMLRVGAEGCIVSRRPEIPYGEDYDTLLRRGLERAIGSIASATRSGVPVQLSLSGGKDSRALLAMAAAGGVASDLRISTAVPSGGPGSSRDIISKDYELACRLVEKMGGTWWQDESTVRRGVSFEEDLAYWQDFRSNGSFEFRSRTTVSEPVQRWTLVGIGGELLRSYVGAQYRSNYPGWWSRSEGVSESAERDAAALFDVICPRFDLDDEVYEASRRAFVSSLMIGEAGGIVERLDRGYYEYRNRSHAGTGRYQLPLGVRTLYPLVQPEFIAASRLLEAEDAEGGRVLFDLIEMTVPELHSLPYASPPWPASFVSASRGSTAWNDIDGTRAALDLSERRARRAEVRWIGEPSAYRFEESALLRVEANVEAIVGVLGLSGTSEAGLLGRIARACQHGENLLRVILAASESATDILSPGRMPCRVLHLSLAGDPRSRRQEILLEDVLSWGAARNVKPQKLAAALDRVDLTGVNGSLSVDVRSDGSQQVKVQLSGLRDGSEAACYLHVAGRRVATEWYSSSGEFVFDIEPSGRDEIRAEIFLRWIGDPVVQRLFNIATTTDEALRNG